MSNRPPFKFRNAEIDEERPMQFSFNVGAIASTPSFVFVSNAGIF